QGEKKLFHWCFFKIITVLGSLKVCANPRGIYGVLVFV
ncbi:MAG: hypothetical protein ACI9R6_000964, partial [Saprospiraceae bacterium]